MKKMRPPHRVLAHLTVFSLLVNFIPPGISEAKADGLSLCSSTAESSYGYEIMKDPKSHVDPKSARDYAIQKRNKENFIAKMRASKLESTSKYHVQYNGTDGINLKASNEARNQFFLLSFGMIPEICNYKKLVSESVDQFAKAPKQVLDNIEGASCEGAASELQKTYKSADLNYNLLNNTIHDLLNGKEGSFPGLEKIYKQSEATNRNEVLAIATKIVKTNQVKASQLNDEVGKLWGTTGYYNKFMTQLRQEATYARTILSQIDVHREKIEALKARCNSAKNSDLSATDKASEDQASQVIESAKAKAKTEATEEPGTQEGDQAPGAGNGDTDTGATDTKLDTSTDTTPPPGTQTENTFPPPPGKETGGEKGGVSNFLANNWKLLVGGAAVVGGTVYLVKRHRENKKEKDKWKDENFAEKHGVTSSSSEGSNGDSSASSSSSAVPAGAKLIVTSAVYAPAVGATMQKIDVSIVNADGVEQAVTGLPVQVSCLTPSPCSLTGPQSVTTVNGKVSFDGLSFNQADQDVQLQFSGPGIEWVTTTGKFNVTGNAARE